MTQPSDVQSTLLSRKKTHGDFRENGIIMQALKEQVRGGIHYANLEHYQREALDMICHKIGRILTGNPNEPDHWHDIAGYATLVENILKTGHAYMQEIKPLNSATELTRHYIKAGLTEPT